MPIEIIVPRLGWSMEEGAFVAWLKRDGDFVHAGEPLFTIEGDKAVQEIESIDSGILRIAPKAPKPGGSIRVGDVLGHLLTREEAVRRATPAVPVTPGKPQAGTAPVKPATVAAAIASPSVPPADKLPAASVKTPAISPRALRLSAELGVNWQVIRGSGRTGRIRERDVRAAAGRGSVPAAGSGAASQSRPSSTAASGRPSAVFFGELLMRLATRHHERFVQAREFEVRYTGAEANAAVTLAGFGLEALVVSAVPGHELGQACLNYLRQFGVNTDHVLRRGLRLGTFFLESGSPPRAAQVIYDRSGSAFAELKPGEVDWDTIFAGRQWFHWSGTAPALSPGLPAVIAEACTAARRLGLQISCDLNYRSKLWNADVARQIMLPLVRQVDVLIGNEEQVELVLGVGATTTDAGTSATERCAGIASRLRTQFNLSSVALTLREGGEGRASTWQATLANQAGTFASRGYPVATVDRIGAGDAFAGALIHGILTGQEPQATIEFAAAAGCLKHSVPGDFNLVTREEVLALVHGDPGQRVRR